MTESINLSNISPKQKEFIISYFSDYKPLVDIKQDFEKFYEQKITGETIQQLQTLCRKDIKDLREKRNQDFSDIGAAQTRIRMLYIDKGLIEASKPKKVYKRIGPEEFDIEYEVDHQAVRGYLQLAKDEDFSSKKLRLDWIKAFETITPPTDSNKLIPIKVEAGDFDG